MMTVTFLKRPLHMRLLWRLEAAYLRWRIKHADRCRAHHEQDLARAKADAERLSHQIDLDDQFVRELVQRLGRVVSK